MDGCSGPRSRSSASRVGFWPSCEPCNGPKAGPRGRPAGQSPAAGSPRSARPSCSTASCWCPTPSAGGRRRARQSSACPAPFWVLLGAFGLAIVTGWCGRSQPDHDSSLLSRPADGGVSARRRARRCATRRRRPEQADSGRSSSMCDPARAGRSVPHHQHQPGADRIRRADLSHAGRRQLHPVAAVLRQQRDRLAADRGSWATS